MLGDNNFGASIAVKDINRACDFYENTLGCKELARDDEYVSLQSGDTQFMLYPSEFAGTAKNTIGGWEVANFDATISELRDKGVKLENYDMPGIKTENGVANYGEWRTAWIKDPDGNILAINGK
jgi:catechol 2,3-dioxygenase-like lactoylglutathione lyase family enzyme